jgi:hypothetical protein
MGERLNRWTMKVHHDDEDLNTSTIRQTVVDMDLPDVLDQLKKWIDQSVPEDGDYHSGFKIHLELN